MEGIIKLFGKVVGITCQDSTCATVHLQVRWSQHKTMQETQFSAECPVSVFKNPFVDVLYSGPAHMDSNKDAAFCFDENVLRTPYGVGLAIDKICVGNNVFVYVRWRKVSGFDGEQSHLVLEEVVITPEDVALCPQELKSFVTDLLEG